MLLHIPGLFSREEVLRIREALAHTEWADGKITAGHQSAKAKHNLQLPEGHPLAKARSLCQRRYRTRSSRRW